MTISSDHRCLGTLAIWMWARPSLSRLLLPDRLSGISIHRRPALGRYGGFGAGNRRRGVSRGRLGRARLDIDSAARPAEIVSPPPRPHDRLALGEGAGDRCVGSFWGSSATAAEQFFRGVAGDRERYNRSSCRPLVRIPPL